MLQPIKIQRGNFAANNSKYISNHRFYAQFCSVMVKFECGYARVAIKEAFVNFSNGALYNLENRKGYFDSVFENCEKFVSCKREWDIYSRGIRDKFRSWPAKHNDEKLRYIEHFSSKNWNDKLQAEKDKHSLHSCQECSTQHRNISKLFTTFCNKKKRGKSFTVTCII